MVITIICTYSMENQLFNLHIYFFLNGLVQSSEYLKLKIIYAE